MAGVTGDFEALENMVAKMRAIGGAGPLADQFRHELLTNCAEAARGELENSFISSIDPYGRPWKPLTSRTGKPLLDTGILASSWTRGGSFPITTNGFLVETNLIYAALHQYGGIVRAKNAPWLLFAVRGAPTGNNPRGAKRWVRAKKVTIPQRQQIPEESTGGMGRWGDAINAEAEDVMASFMAKLT